MACTLQLCRKLSTIAERMSPYPTYRLGNRFRALSPPLAISQQSLGHNNDPQGRFDAALLPNMVPAAPSINIGLGQSPRIVATHMEDVGRRWKTLLEDVGKPRKNRLEDVNFKFKKRKEAFLLFKIKITSSKRFREASHVFQPRLPTSSNVFHVRCDDLLKTAHPVRSLRRCWTQKECLSQC